jgi:hypothetical protein
MMGACPKCKGTTGYEFTMTVEHTMTTDGWDGEPECTDSGRTKTGLCACMDCGAKFRESTIKPELGAKDGGVAANG